MPIAPENEQITKERAENISDFLKDNADASNTNQATRDKLAHMLAAELRDLGW